MSTEIEKSKQELTYLIDRFDNFEINVKKFKEIKQSLSILNGGLTRALSENKYSIINFTEYKFDFQEIHIENLIGCFKQVPKVISSLYSFFYLFEVP